MRTRVSVDANKTESILQEYRTLMKSLRNVNKQRGHLSKELFYAPDIILIALAVFGSIYLFVMQPELVVPVVECINETLTPAVTTGSVDTGSVVMTGALPITGAK